ncbi:hypothetical protein AURDEDRAFT_186967 [Auricularia subglabra TFB-10046 SS5]|nr:hypothetical protein AURDEDRAFT_186967 [Auricularia subglabra TFB-10046 SS5]
MTPDPPPPVPRVLLPRSASNAASSSNVTLSQDVSPEQLRLLVLQYLEHNCYGSTLQALKRDTDAVGARDKGKAKASPTSADDLAEHEASAGISTGDGDFDRTRLGIRTDIRTAILEGAIPMATGLLESHFPSVLRGTPSASLPKPPPWIPSVLPNHISLNLRIQAFIESLHPSPTHSVSASIAAGRKLQAEVTALSDVAYTAEWALVGALLAYSDPLKDAPAPMRRYMLPGRRLALADQVDRAILWSLSIAPATTLETAVRHNAAVWGAANELRLPLDVAALPAGIDAPPRPQRAMPATAQVVPLFDFHEWLKARKDREKDKTRP